MGDFEDHGLEASVWSGLLHGDAAPGRVLLIHLGQVLARADLTAVGAGLWRVAVTLPPVTAADGTRTFLLVADSGDDGDAPAAESRPLASLSFISGNAVEADLRAEIDLIRAELDLLKREFRRFAGKG